MANYLGITKEFMPGLYDLERGPTVEELTPMLAHAEWPDKPFREVPPAWYETEEDIISIVPEMIRQDVDKEVTIKRLLEHEMRHAWLNRMKNILPERTFKEILRSVPMDMYVNKLWSSGEKLSLEDLLGERFAAESFGGLRWRPEPIETMEYVKGLIPMMLYGATEPLAQGEGPERLSWHLIPRDQRLGDINETIRNLEPRRSDPFPNPAVEMINRLHSQGLSLEDIDRTLTDMIRRGDLQPWGMQISD